MATSDTEPLVLSLVGRSPNKLGPRALTSHPRAARPEAVRMKRTAAANAHRLDKFPLATSWVGRSAGNPGVIFVVVGVLTGVWLTGVSTGVSTWTIFAELRK